MRKHLSQIKRAILGWWATLWEKIPLIDKTIINFKIGQTVNGGEIGGYRIGNGPIKILMLAAIHGNEVGTVKLMHFLIDWYKEHLYSRLTVYFIPCLNIDGYKKALKNPDFFGGGRVGRFNTRNVDLNRNFDVPSFKKTASWIHGKNYSERTEVFSGVSGNSEPETKALVDLIKSQNIKIVFSFHNAGADIVANKLAEKIGKIFSEKSGYKFINHEKWLKFNQTGSSYEWFTKNQIALLEIETSSRWASDWKVQKEAIKASFKEIAKETNF
jgi:hypothetical protein